jgi:hypothetical protein
MQCSQEVWGNHEIRLIKIFLNETYNKVGIGRHLSHSFPIQNGLKQGYVLSPLLFNVALEYAITKVQENGKCEGDTAVSSTGPAPLCLHTSLLCLRV